MVFITAGWNGCCVWLTCSPWERQHSSGKNFMTVKWRHIMLSLWHKDTLQFSFSLKQVKILLLHY